MQKKIEFVSGILQAPAMTRAFLIAAALLLAASAKPDAASNPKILKVLPHFLDQQGRHTLSPSLYERDAYQAQLRKHPEKISAVRFDIQWNPGSIKSTNWKIRAEILGRKSAPNEIKTIEKPVSPSFWFENWSALPLSPEEFRALGEVNAWRITLWEGDTLRAEQKSFLW